MIKFAYDEIKKTAYRIYEETGETDAVKNWYQAEEYLLAKVKSNKKIKKKKRKFNVFKRQ